MKVIEKIKDGYIPYKAYEDVVPQFKNFVKFVRVLPAEYFHEPNEYFTLKAMYQPGEKKSFPEGGFEVYYGDGCVHNYSLDQIIVHPFVLGIRKFGTDENTNKIKVIKEVNKTPGKKGRKPLSAEEKAKREQDQIDRKAKSNGKRGRPSKYTPEQKAEMLAKAEARKGGKRGRKKKTI